VGEESTAPAPSPDYPWYRPVTDGSLEQGDILFDLPFVSVVSSYDEILQSTADFEIVYYDAIVLTQSCDLEAGKVDHVVLAPFFSRDELARTFKGLEKSDGERQVQRGRWESLYLLPPCQMDGIEFGRRIVNFRQVIALPFEIVAEHARRQDQRIRFCPPYREHLAQGFARFFMRIGFPLDFRL